MLSESTKQLINASGGGTITNLADDEDIESVGQDLKVLKFADRTYNPVRWYIYPPPQYSVAALHC